MQADISGALRQAEAEVAYYQSIVEYNQALNDLQYRKGTILTHNSIYLLEGGWCPEAYVDAEHHANARAHAIDGSHVLDENIPPFAMPHPVGGVYFTSPEAVQEPLPTQSLPAASIPTDSLPALEPVPPMESAQPMETSE